MSDNTLRMIESIESSFQLLVERNKRLSGELENACKGEQALRDSLGEAELKIKQLESSIESLEKDSSRANEFDVKKKEIIDKIKKILLRIESLEKNVFTNDASESSL